MPETIIRKSAWLPTWDMSVPFARSLKESRFFYCIGGKLNPGETPEDALVREVLEETSARLIRKSITFLRTFEGPAHGIPDALLRMDCFSSAYEGVIKPCGEIAEIEWFTSADMHRTTDVGQQILHWLHERNLIR